MDSQQIHDAMKRRLPVMCDGVRYDYIAEYVSSYDDNGKRRLSCGIVRQNYIMRVPADKVELAERTNDEQTAEKASR